MAEQTGNTTEKLKNKAKASLLLLLIATISITTATYAWFSLSNNVLVQNMEISVATSAALRARAGTTASAITDYYPIIYARANAPTGATDAAVTETALQTEAVLTTGGEKTFSAIKLWPVSSGNGRQLYTQANLASPGAPSPASSLYYVELTMWFMADTDMRVYLNGDESAASAEDGTAVLPKDDVAKDNNAVKALRISFEDVDAGSAVIYEPSPTANVTTTLHGQAGNNVAQTTFTTLGSNAGMTNATEGADTTSVFSLVKGTPKEIKIRMWVEGEDAECVNSATGVNIEKGEMIVRLRFCGANADGKLIETAP